jgi:hypothetical protein
VEDLAADAADADATDLAARKFLADTSPPTPGRRRPRRQEFLSDAADLAADLAAETSPPGISSHNSNNSHNSAARFFSLTTSTPT